MNIQPFLIYVCYAAMLCHGNYCLILQVLLIYLFAQVH
jgi:hypothetical protein